MTYTEGHAVVTEKQRVEGLETDEVLYSDDTICIAQAKAAMERMLAAVECEGAKFGLKLNEKKMQFNRRRLRRSPPPVTYEGLWHLGWTPGNHPQIVTKMGHEAVKIWLKMNLRCPKMAPRWPKMAPR